MIYDMKVEKMTQLRLLDQLKEVFPEELTLELCLGGWAVFRRMNRRKIFFKWSRDSYEKACMRKNVQELREEMWEHQKTICFWFPSQSSARTSVLERVKRKLWALCQHAFYPCLCLSFKEVFILVDITSSHLPSRSFLLSSGYMVDY